MDQIKDQIQKYSENNSTDSELNIKILLSNKDRLEIHQFCEKLNLCSITKGIEPFKYMVITKNKSENLIKNNLILDSYKKLFIGHYSLPIPVYKSPYFEYFIDLYDSIFDTKNKYNLLISAVEILNKRGLEFKKYSYELSDTIANSIKSVKNNSVKTNQKINLPSEIDIYNGQHDHSYFISIDIIKANFTTTKYMAPELIQNCSTWEEFIQKFTDIPYFINSKNFRQIVFGKANISWFTHIQKYLLTQIYDKIINSDIKYKFLNKISNDELILILTQENLVESYEKLKLINNPDIYKLTIFHIEPIENSSGYIKKIIPDINQINKIKYEIRNIDKDFHALAYKKYFGLPVEDYDFVSMKNDLLIKYIQ